MEALKFEYIAPEKLIPYAKNARQHPPEQVAMIMASIKEFGFTMPILVRDDMTLIAGHGRLEAAHKLGLKEVPVVKASYLSDAQARALVHIDNQIALKSQWDFDLLKLELDDIKFDFEPYDFELPEIEDVSKEGLTDDDDVPEVEQNIHGVVLGDIWKLGEHRLMCGDSTDVLHVEKLMDGEKADMVFTDPPYGISYDDKKHKDHGLYKASKFGMILGDDQKFNFKEFAWLPQEEQIWFGANYYCQQLPEGGSWYVWDKKTEAMQANGMLFTNDFEIAWSKAKHKQEICRKIWAGAINKEKNEDRLHPTQKPISLVEWFFERIKANSVLDLFMGSGSTLIACEKTNRKCYGMELDPHYCSVIIERWQKFTGKKAERIQ